MTGYQEVLTDPSYAGQIVTMTAPQIGNYGVAAGDAESQAPQRGRLRHARGVAGGQQLARRRHAARLPGPPQHRRHRRHRHARADARAALGRRDARRHRHRAGRPGGAGREGARDSEDGRRRPRARTSPATAPFEWRDRAAGSRARPITREFGIAPERRATRRLRVAAYDFGIKCNILRRLDAYGCDVHVFPASAPAADLLASSRTASS